MTTTAPAPFSLRSVAVPAFGPAQIRAESLQKTLAKVDQLVASFDLDAETAVSKSPPLGAWRSTLGLRMPEWFACLDPNPVLS
jgi:hypothetical protein